MVLDGAPSRSFSRAARAWFAGVSIAAVSVLIPACAQASTHHASAHHVALHRTATRVSTRHTTSPHHTLSVHKLVSREHMRAEHLARTTHHSAIRHETHYASVHYSHHPSEHYSHHVYVAAKHLRHETHYASVHYSHHLYVAAKHSWHETHYASAYHTHYERVAAEYRHSRLQCVPYAREVSHIELSGDAFLWWAEAAGRYARGNTPMTGAVLNFRSIGRMPLGHVAVVTAVLGPRTILVTQANWVPGSITNDVTVQDVSPNNNWTDVRVELGDGAMMGSVYPTYGFIYKQPDNGTVIAADSNGRNEVAEAPMASPVASEAPDRNLQ